MRFCVKNFSCESVIIRLKGNQLTNEYLLKNGFTKPILITNRDGLDLTLPSRTIRLQEINELVGRKKIIEVFWIVYVYRS